MSRTFFLILVFTRSSSWDEIGLGRVGFVGRSYKASVASSRNAVVDVFSGGGLFVNEEGMDVHKETDEKHYEYNDGEYAESNRIFL